MAKSQNKNKKTFTLSTHTHTKSSRPSRTKVQNHNSIITSKNVILTVIALTSVVVILAFLLTSFYSPENIIKHKIESITADYYENYYYPNITHDNTSSLPDIFSKYADTGFARITFRQLLLFDDERHAEAATTIGAYCDINNSYVQIFPEAPYGKTNFRIDYHYSCTF